jgi:MFS family permease
MQPYPGSPSPSAGHAPRGSSDYLPKNRAAPLGWYFPLFFVLFAFFFFAAGAIAAQFVGEPWARPVFLTLGSLTGLAFIGLLLKSAIVRRALQATFVEAWHDGKNAQAQLLDVELLWSAPKTGPSERWKFREVRLELSVHLPGAAPYATMVVCYFRKTELPYLVPGAVLSVAVHPTDPSVVLVAPLDGK